MRNIEILNSAKENYSKVCEYHKMIGYDPNLGSIWQNNMGILKDIVYKSNNAEEVIDLIDRTFCYSINFPPEQSDSYGGSAWRFTPDNPRIREKAVDWLIGKQNLNPSIEESNFIHFQNKVTRNDKILSPNFLRCYSIAQRILKYNQNVNHVLELGAGAGHQARTLMLLTNCKYTIVDLPETLIFSFIHLSLCFPDKKVLFVTSPNDIDTVNEYDIVLVPAVFSNLLEGKEYDVFVNCASMGEMNNSTIHRWMNFIQNKVKIQTLFTLNRFLNTVDNNLLNDRINHRINHNECSVSYDSKWNILNWELEPIYCRCPYLDCIHARYVEIIASRPSNTLSEEQKIIKSQELLQDVLDEDWVRLSSKWNELVMMAGHNILVNDTTMTGCLFKLWESIRLNPNKNNIITMLKYLNKLVKQNYLFEEMPYYENLLKSIK